MVFPVPALDREVHLLCYKFHSLLRTGDGGYSQKILLNQAGADAPRAKAPREKYVRQWHVICHTPIAPGRTRSWPTARQPLGFRGPPGRLGQLFLIDAADAGTPCRAGPLAQLNELALAAPQTRQLRLPDCGHSPQRDHPVGTLEAVLRVLKDVPWEAVRLLWID